MLMLFYAYAYSYAGGSGGGGAGSREWWVVVMVMVLMMICDEFAHFDISLLVLRLSKGGQCYLLARYSTLSLAFISSVYKLHKLVI